MNNTYFVGGRENEMHVANGVHRLSTNHHNCVVFNIFVLSHAKSFKHNLNVENHFFKLKTNECGGCGSSDAFQSDTSNVLLPIHVNSRKNSRECLMLGDKRCWRIGLMSISI